MSAAQKYLGVGDCEHCKEIVKAKAPARECAGCSHIFPVAVPFFSGVCQICHEKESWHADRRFERLRADVQASTFIRRGVL